MNDVTVCIPSIPPRKDKLLRAVKSVINQKEPPDAIAIAIDTEHEGAAVTRNRVLNMATTEFVAFLDDDDEMFPQHLSHLFARQRETEADVVWPWFEMDEWAWDPLGHEHRDWDPDEPHQFPITTIVRRELALDVGGFPEGYRASETCAGEDWVFWCRLNDAGAKFVRLAERTWIWHWEGNTSGLGDRW